MIDYKLDVDNGVELENLIGEITISNGKNLIVLQNTYVDSIFEALLDGVTQLKVDNCVSIELVEEPGSFEFEVIGPDISISYLQKTVYLDRIEFSKRLKEVIDNFLGRIENIFGDNKSLIVRDLENFIARLKF